MSQLELSLVVKLASLVYHVQEAHSPGGTEYDVSAAARLADDPEVVAWLSTIDPVFLPVKR